MNNLLYTILYIFNNISSYFFVTFYSLTAQTERRKSKRANSSRYHVATAFVNLRIVRDIFTENLKEERKFLCNQFCFFGCCRHPRKKLILYSCASSSSSSLSLYLNYVIDPFFVHFFN